MDDMYQLIREALAEKMQERLNDASERAQRAIDAAEEVSNADDAQMIVDNDLISDFISALYLPMRSLNNIAGRDAIGAAMAVIYYKGYKAGQEAEAHRKADDTNGVDWSGEVR
jgi:hypothetical protein